jgi:hypothetical protein
VFEKNNNFQMAQAAEGWMTIHGRCAVEAAKKINHPNQTAQADEIINEDHPIGEACTEILHSKTPLYYP